MQISPSYNPPRESSLENFFSPRMTINHLDGSEGEEIHPWQHALDPGDKIRDEWLRAEGYKALRFWDKEVFINLESLLEIIRNALLTPHPDPLLQGEREDNF